MKTFIKSIIKSIDASAVPYIMVGLGTVTCLLCLMAVFRATNYVREDIITDGYDFKIMAEHLDSSRAFMKKNWYSWNKEEKAVMARRYVWSAAKIARSQYLYEDKPGFDKILSAESIHSIKCIDTKLNTPLKEQVYFSWWWDSTYIELGNVIVNSNSTFKL